jgi:hypothetical protein
VQIRDANTRTTVIKVPEYLLGILKTYISFSEQEYSQPGTRLQYGIQAAKMIIKYKMFVNGAGIA